MIDPITYLWCALGIVISVILPVIWELVYQSFPRKQRLETLVKTSVWRVIWDAAKPYLLLALASLITALLIVGVLGDTLKDSRAALLAGYAWDSTLQKLRR